MSNNTDHLKKRAKDSLDNKVQTELPVASPIVKGTKSFIIGTLLGILICLMILPMLGYYPNLQDSIISAVIGGIINVITNQIVK